MNIQNVRVLLIANVEESMVWQNLFLRYLGQPDVLPIQNWDTAVSEYESYQPDIIVIADYRSHLKDEILAHFLEKTLMLVKTIEYHEDLHNLIQSYDGGYIWKPVIPGELKSIWTRLLFQLDNE